MTCFSVCQTCRSSFPRRCRRWSSGRDSRCRRRSTASSHRSCRLSGSAFRRSHTNSPPQIRRCIWHLCSRRHYRSIPATRNHPPPHELYPAYNNPWLSLSHPSGWQSCCLHIHTTMYSPFHWYLRHLYASEHCRMCRSCPQRLTRCSYEGTRQSPLVRMADSCIRGTWVCRRRAELLPLLSYSSNRNK